MLQSYKTPTYQINNTIGIFEDCCDSTAGHISGYDGWIYHIIKRSKEY